MRRNGRDDASRVTVSRERRKMNGKMYRFFLPILIASFLFGCSSAPIEPTATATLLPTGTPTLTITPSPTATFTVTPTQTPELSECPKVSEDSTWERYKPNTFSNLLSELNQSSSRDLEENPNSSFYIEFSSAHQFPSCIRMMYSGNYREITPLRKFLIENWAGILGIERRTQLIEMHQHEVLLTDNEQEYWFLIQEPLIPYMEKEIEKNAPVIIFIIFAGSNYLEEAPDYVLIISEFAKPK
jgi:hypothetical protein